MVIFYLLSMSGENITMGGERIIKDVFRETFDVCPLCSVFIWYAVVWYFCICVICPGVEMHGCASLIRTKHYLSGIGPCI